MTCWKAWTFPVCKQRIKGDSLRWCIKISSNLEPKGVELMRGKIAVLDHNLISVSLCPSGTEGCFLHLGTDNLFDSS